MKNKKILLLGQYFYPEKISSGVLPYELAIELVKNDFFVSALVGKPKEYSERNKKILKKERKLEINIRRIAYFQANRKGFLGRIINILSFSISILMHPSYFKRHDYYICFTNPPLLPVIAAFYSKLFRKKLILVIYDLYPDNAIKLEIIKEGSSLAKIFNYLYKFVFNNTYKIVAISTEIKEYLVNNKKLLEEQVVVIPNWYKDIGDIQNKVEVKYPIRVLYGGNMGLAQDLDTLIDAIIALNNDDRIEFIFAGHGVKKDDIIARLKQHNIKNFKMLGFLEKTEYDNLLHECNIAVLSLNANVHGLGSPSKYYGYLASKKPVIAIMPEKTDVVRDITEYNHGVHISNGDTKLLVSRLKEILADLSLLEIMSQQSYKLFSERYTIEICAKKYIDLLNEESNYEYIQR